VNEDVIDYELLEDLIIHIDEDCEAGAVLVFLPGMAEIQLMKDRLSASRRFSGSASEWLLPLHSSVASSDQRRVFQRPPSGNRKIVLATNIAETSITVDDVVHVIDCGKHKENRFDPRRVPSLVPFFPLLWRVVWAMHFVDVSIVWVDVLPGIIFCQLCFDAGDVEHG
jgi:ATP-dependent RNA helicase DHX29